jgi:sec-independent protein translocase protein TatA
MGNIGVPELIIIFVVALIVFGPKKLPELGKSLGRGLSEFRRASNELKATLEEEVRSIETEPVSTTTPPAYTSHSSPAADPLPVPKSITEASTDVH